MIEIPEFELEQMARAERVATAFDRWRALQKRLAQDPQSVSAEEMSAAWDQVMEAHERWGLAR